MSDRELLPCPKCGSKSQSIIRRRDREPGEAQSVLWTIRCDYPGCFYRRQHPDSMGGAMGAWNHESEVEMKRKGTRAEPIPCPGCRADRTIVYEWTNDLGTKFWRVQCVGCDAAVVGNYPGVVEKGWGRFDITGRCMRDRTPQIRAAAYAKGAG